MFCGGRNDNLQREICSRVLHVSVLVNFIILILISLSAYGSLVACMLFLFSVAVG
jgi:hypothetical protein